MTARAEMTATPLLQAVEEFRGSVTDLERGQVIGPAALAAGRQSLAHGMHQYGLDAGDRVLLAVGNGPLFFAAWAAALMGSAAPILTHFETPPAELLRIAQRFSARFVVTDNRTESELQAIGCSVRPLTCDTWGRLAWAAFPAGGRPADSNPAYLPGVPLHLTSGTTDRPKLAIRPAAAAVAEAERYVETIGIGPDDTVLAVAPMSHAYAHGMCVITPILTSANVVALRRFQPKRVFEACGEYPITVLPAVAAMLDVLLFGAGDRLYDPSRRVITGGAPLPERTAANFQRIAGTRVRPLYGTTETGAIVVAPADGPAAVGGCVGPPLAGVQVEIRPTTGAPNPERQPGLVHVRSSSMMTGYLVDEQIDRSALVDGWFNTGDLGWIDPDGALHLSGRQADVINVSGMKVLPSEVAEVIAALPEVVDVHVYAGKNRSGAHHVRAAVAVRTAIEARAIEAHCRRHLVYYKVPARIILVDALPRSPAGKIDRHRLP